MIMFNETTLRLSNTITLFYENNVVFERYGKDVSDLRSFMENQTNIFMSDGCNTATFFDAESIEKV